MMYSLYLYNKFKEKVNILNVYKKFKLIYYKWGWVNCSVLKENITILECCIISKTSSKNKVAIMILSVYLNNFFILFLKLKCWKLFFSTWKDMFYMWKILSLALFKNILHSRCQFLYMFEHIYWWNPELPSFSMWKLHYFPVDTIQQSLRKNDWIYIQFSITHTNGGEKVYVALKQRENQILAHFLLWSIIHQIHTFL
jgi:hypothetical protein